MKRVRTATDYEIELTVEEFESRGLLGCADALVERLEEIEAVIWYDWSGHFGPRVFLRLDADKDTEGTWKEIWAALGVEPSAVD